MIYYIAHALRRSNLKCFPDCAVSITHSVQSGKLLSSHSSEHHKSSTMHSMLRFIHFHRGSQLSQLLRNPQSGFLSPVILKMDSDLCLWKSFSSKYGQVMTNNTSKSHKGKATAFMNLDNCKLLDTNDDLISYLTFAEAKALAETRKCRLVYMSKNSGVSCFKLQTVVDALAAIVVNDTPKDGPPKYTPKEKPKKSRVKEFRIQGSITDHDLAIKFTKMRSLLADGKQLVVNINVHARSSESGITTGTFVKKITELLKDVCQIQVERSNDSAACLKLTPNKKEQSQII